VLLISQQNNENTVRNVDRAKLIGCTLYVLVLNDPATKFKKKLFFFYLKDDFLGPSSFVQPRRKLLNDFKLIVSILRK